MGRTVVHQLVARKVPTLVIEKDQRKIERLDRMGTPYVFGDATDDETLIEAGVQRATSLATVLSADADNLFVTLSAHSINPYLTVIARASSEKSESCETASPSTCPPYSPDVSKEEIRLVRWSITRRESEPWA